MLFEIESDRARLRESLGIFYRVSQVVEADTANEAEFKFREKYETAGAPLKITVLHETKHERKPL